MKHENPPYEEDPDGILEHVIDAVACRYVQSIRKGEHRKDGIVEMRRSSGRRYSQYARNQAMGEYRERLSEIPLLVSPSFFWYCLPMLSTAPASVKTLFL